MIYQVLGTSYGGERVHPFFFSVVYKIVPEMNGLCKNFKSLVEDDKVRL